MATRAFTFVSSFLALIGCWLHAGSHQQVCWRWSGKADIYAGLIGLGKEDGVRGCDAAPAPPPASPKGTRGPNWNPLGAPGEGRGASVPSGAQASLWEEAKWYQPSLGTFTGPWC